MTTKRHLTYGFTIIELGVVIVIIGILATVTIVAYNGIQRSARDGSVLSDLDNLDGVETRYGLQNNIVGKAYYSGSGVDAALDFMPSPGNVIDVVIDATDYCIRGYNLQANKNSISNAALKESSVGACTRIAASAVAQAGSPPSITCPTGFIVIPGSPTYGTADFCTMKYNAKNVNGVATSQAANTPWVSISQTTAISTSSAACAGCHLLTEPEYLTIAQNVLGVASNWSGGAVGSGFIYSGHNDNVPANALAADPSDANGYAGTGNSSPSNQRRTLTLSNGEVIWDLSGNVVEWTSATSTTGQPGITGEPGYAWKEWTAVTAPGSLSANPSPSGTNLTGASTWNSGKGVGKLYSYSGESAVRGLVCGGSWVFGSIAGVLTLDLSYTPSAANTGIGFRVSR